jgi:hypothetical protein
VRTATPGRRPLAMDDCRCFRKLFGMIVDRECPYTAAHPN